MTRQGVIFLGITLIANLGFACIIGSVAVESRILKICEGQPGRANSYSEAINNRMFLDFLLKNRENKELSNAAKRVFNVTTEEFIAHLEGQIKVKEFYTQMSADRDSDVPELRKIAKAFNDLNGYSDLIEAELKKEDVKDQELKMSTPINDMAELDKIAEINGAEITRLKERCSKSKKSDVANMSAVQAIYPSDGTSADFVPYGMMKENGKSDRGQLILIKGGKFTFRTVFKRGEKFYWVGDDGKEWEVKLSKVSFKRRTQLRPIGFGEFSDACYLSYEYQSAPGADNPRALAADSAAK